jgi:hypothetical protein
MAAMLFRLSAVLGETADRVVASVGLSLMPLLAAPNQAGSPEPRWGLRAVDLHTCVPTAVFPEVARVYASQASAAQEIQIQARTAAELDVLAVRGLGIVGLNASA